MRENIRGSSPKRHHMHSKNCLNAKSGKQQNLQKVHSNQSINNRFSIQLEKRIERLVWKNHFQNVAKSAFLEFLSLSHHHNGTIKVKRENLPDQNSSI